MLGPLKKRKRLRVHGFLARSKTPSWKKILKNRRRKGRHELTVSYPKRVQYVRWKARMHIIAWGSVKQKIFDGKGNLIKK